MKHGIHILIILFGTLLLTSCEKNRNQDLWCDFTIEVILPKGYEHLPWRVRDASYLTNQNTKEQFSLPEFIDGKGSVRIMKGYYLMGLFVEVSLNGKTVHMYNADFNSPENALYLLNESECRTLRLSLTQNGIER